MTKTWRHIHTVFAEGFRTILFRDRPSSRPRPVSFCAAFLPETVGGFQSLPHPKPVENRDSRNQSLRTSGGLRDTLCRRPPAAIRKGCRSAPQAPHAQAARGLEGRSARRRIEGGKEAAEPKGWLTGLMPDRRRSGGLAVDVILRG